MWKACGSAALVCVLGGFSWAEEPRADKKGKPAPQSPDAPGKKKDASPKPEAELPATGYGKALRKAVGTIEPKESGGLTIKLEVIPDAYRYLMAEAYDELRKAAYPRWELEKKLRAKHNEYKDKKSRVLLICELVSGGGKDHHFLQSQLGKHVNVRTTSDKSIVVFGEDSKPKFEDWQVFEQQRDQRKVLKKPLAKLTKLNFRVTAPLKPTERDTLKVSFRNLVRITDRHEEQKKDYRAFEGINTSTKQISSNSWADQTVPEITFELQPGTWEIPDPPAGFDDLLKAVEKG